VERYTKKNAGLKKIDTDKAISRKLDITGENLRLKIHSFKPAVVKMEHHET